MTARDRYLIKLTCPSCKATGIAQVSENDGWAATHDPGFSIQIVSAGFRVAKNGRTATDTDFGCIACNIVSEAS